MSRQWSTPTRIVVAVIILILGAFLLVQLRPLIASLVGLAIGLPGAVPIALVTGLFTMIPELGPTIAGIIASLVAFFLGSTVLPISNFWFALLVAGIYVVIMQIKSIWLRPQVMGRFMHMHTGLVFLAILAAVMLQGILAAFVILPILATVASSAATSGPVSSTLILGSLISLPRRCQTRLLPEKNLTRLRPRSSDLGAW